MVILSQLIRPEWIDLDSPAEDGIGLIRGLVERLAQAGAVSEVEPMVEALLERERVMSTGIGGGVAIPHAQSRAARRAAVALARPRKPIEFDASDGKPVELAFMVVGPEERGGFIRILARLSRLLYSGRLQTGIAGLDDPEEVHRLLCELEAELGS